MTGPSLPTPRLRTLAKSIYDFEAAGSRRNTGTGSRREGDRFEELVLDFWEALADYTVTQSAGRTRLRGPSNSSWARLDYEDRSLYLPARSVALPQSATSEDSRWLGLRYAVSDLIATFPGAEEAVSRYGPDTGPFSGEAYPTIYERRKTTFDGAILLVEKDVLREKILLEYKTAKSTKGHAIDGNAHERLSFQILQYLEVATRYSACSFAVIVNGAFTKYRNKYHVNFRVQADRLRVFRWFDMEYLTTVSEYTRLAGGLCEWLFAGRSRKGP